MKRIFTITQSSGYCGVVTIDDNTPENDSITTEVYRQKLSKVLDVSAEDIES